MTKPSLFIKNAIIHLENGKQLYGSLYINNGKISSYQKQNTSNQAIEPSVKIIDANFAHLIPGFIDSHIHGANGTDVMDDQPHAIEQMATYLPQEGTTSFLATTMTASVEKIEKALEHAGRFENQLGQAELLGVHLEGPFISETKAGAQPSEHILKPNRELFKAWQAIANGRIKIVTLAPELDPVGEFIAEINQAGCIAAAGHTAATFADLKSAVSHGVSQLTHLCNAMNPIHHRDVGPIGAAFLCKELKAEVIADEVHLAKEMLEIIYERMGSDRIILVTDAIRAKGLPNGEYDLAGQMISVRDGKATLPSGQLAGSTLSMQQAAQNMLKIKTVTFRDIIKMTAVNPAKQLGVYNRKGSITIGKDADLLLVDDELNIIHTICKGWLTN